MRRGLQQAYIGRVNSLLRIGTVITLIALHGSVARAESKSSGAATALSALSAIAGTSKDASTGVVDSAASSAAASLAEFKLPDLKTASVTELAGLASQALDLWDQATGGAAGSGVTAQLQSLKTAISQGNVDTALSGLAKLGDYAKSIPGAEKLLQSSKQLVSAWALKQGFDGSKISGVLGALQKGDYGALATQAGALLAKGGVTNEQKTLVNDVLEVFGVSATQSGGAASALKGLFGK